MSPEQFPPAETEDTFALLANETRIDILRALWAAVPDSPSFSALRERVGAADSGTFNYHLNQLRPTFVAKEEGCYTLTYAGRQTIGYVVSGRFGSDDPEVGPVPAGECLFCGAVAEATYGAGAFAVSCPDCESRIVEMAVPPVAVADADPEALPERASDHARCRSERLSRGFCSVCDGRVDAELTVDAEDAITHRPELGVRFDCRECGAHPRLNVAAVVLDHPAVVSLLHDAGIDLGETYVWELRSLLDPEAAVRGRDPLELRLRFEIAGEALELTVDASASVTAYERA